MKGIVLAGGLGTRLYPLTYATNKHLLPVYDRPMIFYPIQTLVRAGVEEIMIVTGGPHAGHFLRVLRNGEGLGVKNLSYSYQEGNGGISEALLIAEDFSDGEDVAVILGDNVTEADIASSVRDFKGGATVFLKEVPDPQRYGVPVFKDGSIVNIEEKPTTPKSRFAVTGLYLYDSKCFDYIKKLKPSDRGQLEVTDLNNIYLKEGALSWEELPGFWTDAGTYETLYLAGRHWASKI